MEYLSNQRCAFPPCTNSFPRLNRKKKYCSGCCRVKDFNRRNKQQESSFTVPAANKETKPSCVEPAHLAAPPISFSQSENTQAEAKKGMTLAGVGEAAIGTAGVMLLKDQLFDKDHRDKLQQQMNYLIQQQARNARQLQEIRQKLEHLCKVKEGSTWDGKMLI